MSLLSTHPSSGSGLQISLHPLVLLTVSDYVTRHTLRNSPDVIVGALLGQQSGRNITLEYAFECKTVQSAAYPDQIILHDTWFRDRLQQYKDVHKDPPLELMGWFTMSPPSGPEAVHIPIHQQILQAYNETAIMLCLHPGSVADSSSDTANAGVGGKLPLTIYESEYGGPTAGERGAMDMDSGQEQQVKVSPQGQENATLDLRFRELPYSIETGEAEMIAVDFVARGGGNATAVDGGPVTSAAAVASDGREETGSVDGKGKGVLRETKPVEESSALSPEDEEQIASLTARANAVKMLHTRIDLLKSYLISLPPSYLTAAAPSNETASDSAPPIPPANPPLNHPLLRSISALLARLPLLSSPTSITNGQTHTTDFTAQSLDTTLVALLGLLGSSVKETRELGRKFSVVEHARSVARRSGMLGAGAPGGGSGGPMGMDDSALGGGSSSGLGGLGSAGISGDMSGMGPWTLDGAGGSGGGGRGNGLV